MSFPILEVSLVLVAVEVPLKAPATTEVIYPLAVTHTILAIEDGCEVLSLPQL